MSSIQEQFLEATKTHFETQLAMINSLTAKAFGEAEKVIALNVNAAKASFEDTAAASKQLIAAKDLQAFLAITAAQSQPSAEKALAYGRELASLTSGSHKEIAQAAEAHIADSARKLNGLIDEVAKNAPAGSEAAVEMLKSVLSNANAGYEQLSKSTKQAVETLEENLAKATESFNQAAAKTVVRTGKK